MADKKKITSRGRSPVAVLLAGLVALSSIHLGFTRQGTGSPFEAIIKIDTSAAFDSLASDSGIAVAAMSETDSASVAEAAVEISHELGEGRASYYGSELAGRPTANGERFDPGKFTAAHPSLPFGTRLRVTNLRNGRSVVVRINDRGPFGHGRVLDLSYAAAEMIGMIRRGTARVKMEVLK